MKNTKNTAKENIALLPEYCYTVWQDKRLVIMKAGEMGYFTINTPLNLGHVESLDLNNDQVADILNEKIGVTKGERQAIEYGSQFGYSSPLANPENYDKDGNIIK